MQQCQWLSFEQRLALSELPKRMDMISVQQRYVIRRMNIIALTVRLGMRLSFSMILAQMVFIPNLNQTANPNDEIICPVNEIQETSVDNQTNTVIDKILALNRKRQNGNSVNSFRYLT